MISLTKRLYLAIFVLISVSCALILTPKNIVEVFSVDMEDSIISFHEAPPVPRKLTYAQKRDIKCLSENIYFESGAEGHMGWLAVGMVTMNRVYSGKFPDNVCDVVNQNNGKVYQFSWVAKKKRLTIKDKELYNVIYNLATLIYFQYDHLQDVTDNALFFHANYVNPGWSKRLKKTVVIGRHIFYKL